MSMQQKRDDLGKLLACFLVSRKGDSTIYELERDYKENEGRPIPYRDFGCISVLDFLRSIPDHVRLSPSNGTHLVFPVVSEKIKHVNDLVVKQRAAKKSCSSRRKTSKPSRYCPRLREPSPFIPNNVQKEIASILTREPNGVKKDYIVQYLQNSRSIAGTVDLTNVDDYLTSMSHIAYTRGNMVFPSLSLHVTSNVAQHNTQPPNRPEAGKSNMSETPQPMMSINSTPVMNTYPAGAEEDEDMFYDDEFGDEEIRLHCASMGNYKVDTDNQPQQSSWTSLEQGVGRMSSAEFIARGAGSYEQRQSQTNTLHLRNNNIDEEAMNELTYSTYASDDEEFDIINDRLKSRLQQLIQKHPDGIWCADLPQTFLDEYSVPLDYAELGFQSVCDLASRLPSIFHLCRWDNRGDFILYDATEPVPTNIKKTDFDEQDSDWADAIDDDYEDIDPIPPTLDLQESQKLIPHDVMSHGESVGQQRIPEFPSDGCVHHLEVFVSEVYTPSLFWVHLRKKRLKLGQLMENMHEFYQREGLNYTIPTVILEKGLNCVCMFEDKWHRAIIKTVKPDGDVTLIFYDYGTTKTYPSEDVRFLHRLFSNLPAQSIPCGLYNIRPLKHDAWTRGASSDFWDKVADIPLVAIVNKVDRENNSMLISLVDTREQTDDHINDWMVHKGLAEFGSMGDTVALESSYLDDRKIDLQETIKGTENVPLISPQSILLESSAKSVRPPPGFTKPLEPSDFAALVSEYLSGKDYTSTEMGNSPFFNSSDANENNNPIVPPSEAIMELLKKPWEIYLQLTTIFHQLLLQNVNVHTTNQTMQNTSCTTASPSTTKNSDMQRSTTNPFQTYQENNNEDLATTINGCAASSDYSTNVNTDEPNLPCFTSSTPFSNSDKTASGSNKDSNFRTFDAQKFLHEEQVFPAKNDNHPPAMLNSTHVNSHSFGIGYLNESLSNGGPTIFYDKNSNLPATGQSNVQNESHDIKTANECTSCHFSKLTENEHSIHVNNGNEFSTPEKNESYKNTFSNANQKIIGTNCVNSDENGAFTKWEFHDTNPFKEYVTTNFSHNIKTEKEESFAEKSINVIEKPPIPPRNPKLINKTVIACKDKIKEVKCDQSTDVGTVLNKPTSNVYYKSGPVMYDIQQNETNTKNDERSEQTPVSTTLVSFQNNRLSHTVNSTQNDPSALPSYGEASSYQNSVFSESNSEIHTDTFDGSFTPHRRLSPNHLQSSTPRIITNTYRAPPPSYTDTNQMVFRNKNKSPISPQFSSPVLSDTSRTAINEIRLATEIDLFDKLQFVPTETSTSPKYDHAMKNIGTHSQLTSSSSTPMTNNHTIFTTTLNSHSHKQNVVKINDSYNVDLISPKCRQVKQSTIKLKQERLANLRQRIAAKMTSVLPPEKENMDQNFTKQEEVLPDVEQNVPRLLSWSKQHQETYHLDEISQGSSETPVSGRTTCEMKIELDNCTGARNKEICNRKERHNKYSTTPNQESPRTSVNGQNLFKNGNANCENSNQHVTLNNNNNLEFCDTKDINTSPDVIPYHLQLQFINLNPHLPHSYGQQHYGSNYPYRAQQPHIMQHPPVIQQLPLFRPSAPRFYTHASNWHRPPFVNPAPNYQFTNIPYAHQYSQSWNPYHNSRFYIPNQTNQTPRVPLGASTTKSPSNTGVDFDKKKLSSRLNDSQIPPHQAKANINIGQHSQMSGEISEFSSYDTTQSDSSGFTEYTEHSKNSNGPEAPIDSHSNRSSEYDNCDLSTHLGKLSLSTDNHDVTKNGLLSSIEEDTATSPKYDQVIPAAVVPLRVVSKKTRNENDNNISPPTSSRDLTKVFKPIGE
ncbi:uncharacterized protein LOC124406606 isoform X2 [Diprion similis]|uniref:uncharacterized protein LOC124406606 isoform X2 n=1 Tax=Diprion similis TaxID=362088 RepID=UPI001EF87542|nr:uncharacterized protein LOC124406606 isoform X2 [Diprion similis]